MVSIHIVLRILYFLTSYLSVVLDSDSDSDDSGRGRRTKKKKGKAGKKGKKGGGPDGDMTDFR